MAKSTIIFNESAQRVKIVFPTTEAKNSSTHKKTVGFVPSNGKKIEGLKITLDTTIDYDKVSFRVN